MGGPAPAAVPDGEESALTPMEAESIKVYDAKEPWPEAYDVVVRLALLGAANVGKSTLAHRFCGSKHDRTATIGVDLVIRPAKIGTDVVRIEIFDTAGMERFSTLVHSYVRGVHVALVCYDVGSRDTFAKVADVLSGCEKYWRDAPPLIALCGTKSDLLHVRARAVPTVEAAEYASKRGLFYFEVSGLTGRQVRVAFLTLVRAAIGRVKRDLPPPPDPAAEARRERLKAASSRLERIDKERRLSLELAAPPPPAPPSEPSDEGTNSEAEEDEGRRKASRARQVPVRLNGVRRGVPLEPEAVREKRWYTCWY